MDTEVIRTYDKYLTLRDVWGELLQRTSHKSISQTFDWFKTWWEGFGKDKELFVIIVKDDKTIRGIAPFMIVKGTYRGLPVRELRFIENEHSPDADFIIASHEKDVAEAIMKVVMLHREKWTIIRLNNIPKESPNVELISSAACRCGLLFGIQAGLQSPYLKIHEPWEKYLSGKSRKFRKTFRNKMNRLSRDVAHHVACYETESDWSDVMSAIYTISEKSWKAAVKQDITSTEGNRVFFRNLTKIAAGNKWLTLWLLSINGTPVAYEYHLSYDNNLYALRADFDEAYEEISPGSILDYTIVENAFKRGYKEYHMCGSPNFYKLNWTSEIKEHVKITFYPKDIYGRLLYAIEYGVVQPLRKIALLRTVKEYMTSAPMQKEVKE